MCNLILFGASGNIARKKIFPALYEWYNDPKSIDIPNINKVIGYGRTNFSQEQFQEIVNNEKNMEMKFINRFDYQTGQYDLYDDFVKLKIKIKNSHIPKNEPLILYLGIPSKLITDIIKNLVLSGIDQYYDCRYILEKPIGNNLKECNLIISEIEDLIDVNKIYIIDHYLGKSNIRDLIKKMKRKI